jgi:hypothetical protein
MEGGQVLLFRCPLLPEQAVLTYRISLSHSRTLKEALNCKVNDGWLPTVVGVTQA